MRTGFLARILLSATIIFTLTIIAANAAGSGNDADLHAVEVEATPATQGIGGVCVVRATALFYGGCCYNLYASDVTAELEVPEEVQIVGGPTPSKYDSVTAIPGGIATEIPFEWSVKSTVLGSHDLWVTIRTKNCGSTRGNVTLEYVEGAAISEPSLFPDPPDLKRDLYISVNVSLALEGVWIESVSLYTLEGRYKKAEAANATLVLPNNDTIPGTGLDMIPHAYEEDLWGIQTEADREGWLTVWFVVTSSDGKNSTSPMYTLEVIDRDKVYKDQTRLYWISILMPMFGAMILLGGNHFLLSRRIETIMIDRSRGAEADAMRTLTFFGFLAFGIIVVMWAYSNGTFGEIAEALEEFI